MGRILEMKNYKKLIGWVILILRASMYLGVLIATLGWQLTSALVAFGAASSGFLILAIILIAGEN